MPKPVQMKLLRRPPRARKKKYKVLERPKSGAPLCMNWLRKRELVDGHYIPAGARRCAHKGMWCNVNGGMIKMTLCICCVSRLRKQNIGVEVL